jgi:hypothetical protein
MRQNLRHSVPGNVQSSRWFTHPIILMSWTIVCLLIGGSLIRSGFQARSAFEAKRLAEDNVKEKEKKGLELMEQLKRSNTPYATEQIIRDELNMQLPGEVILQLPSPSP